MSPEPWFIYLAECSDKTLYVGISNNVIKRIEKHKNKSEARKREIQLKGWSRKKKLWLIDLQHK
jgi:predicted GIY-YIG superfamily endonuclease